MANLLFFSCFIIFIFNSLKGEGLNDLKNQVVEGLGSGAMVHNDNQTTKIANTNIETGTGTTTGEGGAGQNILDVEKPRPASATPAWDNISTTSSLNNTPSCNADVIDHQQSPARSPHARSWTVPGGLKYSS